MSEASYAAQLASMGTQALSEFESGLSSAAAALASMLSQQGQAAELSAAGAGAAPSESGGGSAQSTPASTPAGAPTQSAPTQSTATQSAGDAGQSQADATAGGQSTPPTPGSATVVGSAADSEYAFDNSFTPGLVAALNNDPNLSLDQALQDLSGGSLAAFGGAPLDNDNGLHHPTIVQYGQTDENTGESRDNKKIAVLVANQNYNAISSLGTPIAEANSMSSALASRGYDANVHNDQTATQMGSLWDGMVGAAQEGDDLVAFYGGHGAPEGLVGVNYSFNPVVNDIYANGSVEGVVSSATSKGAHIRFVMDSCHSGHAAQAVRTERQNELAQQADSIEDHVRVAAMTAISGAKQMLVEHVEKRERDLNQLDQAIAQHQAQMPPPGNLIATAKYQLILAGLQAARAGTEKYYDTQADRLWAAMGIALAAGRRLAGHTEPVPALTDYRTLGAQINYLDDLWNTVSQPMERALAAEQQGP